MLWHSKLIQIEICLINHKNKEKIEMKQVIPKVHDTAFIAEGVKIMGNVIIKKDASIWYNSVIRCDEEKSVIEVGERTNIQDGSVVHIDRNKSTIIGDDVVIGHNCIIHACTIENGCLIGMGATVLSGAHIKKGAIVGAGAVVKENMVVEENTLVVGIPAKQVKILSPEIYEHNIQHAAQYVKFAKEHKNGKYPVYSIS
jgi:carbonic anhydrase/acetyltransferase-like protein (isoleucine patch superfamily)